MKVRDLFKEKIRPVHTIAGHRSVDNAIDMMTGKQATALIVTKNEEPIGIFTERDVFRFFQRNIKTALSEIAVQNAMTDNLITAKPEDDISRIMAIMLKADIRHMPVIEEKKFIGLLTLNDLTEHQIELLNDEIQQLKDYIDDLHDAGLD
jgi:CBS domain-containing protein